MDITIDFGGTTIKLGLVRDGALISRKSLPALSGSGLLQRLPDVELAVHEMLQELQISLQQCRGVGMAIPGLVDSTAMTLMSANEKYVDAVGFSFANWAKEAFSLPIVLENDARAALLGETAFGVAKGETDAVLMIFGTGIGTSAMINGQVIRGKHHQAGILGGHFITDVYGFKCTCGNQGCLEAHSSHWALPSIIKQHAQGQATILSTQEESSYLKVIQATEAGDQVAEAVLEDLIMHWSAGIINLVHAYDPEIIILSGGLMNSADLLLPRFIERVHQLAWAPWGKVRFAVAEDPDLSVLLGVSHLLSIRSADK
ncbi:ROK family protein [Paenibacillus psychroresistens]|uniref:ROK family protein n=1 Tax=Paenibacillus psychroresistens TaxID=1778678 RepID=UPI001391E1EF|nr:ROK family protein [Paenibacillus psychroresistens]